MPNDWSEDTGLGDIEDLLRSQDIDLEPRESRKGVTVRIKRRKKHLQELPNIIDDDSYKSPKSVIPGTQTIYIKTWGCTHNTSDSEYMAGLLSAYGYTLTEKKDEADLWLLNSCTVKNPAEDHFRNEIDAAQKAGKFVVVGGCVSQGAPRAQYLRGVSIIGVQQIDRVVEVVEETLKGNSVRLIGQKKEDGKKKGGAPLSLPKVRRNPLVEIIAISTGCLNQCTYCKTRHARGHLGSYPPDEIVNRVKEAFNEGVCEIWLTSEDTGAYGRDIGTNLPELLWKVVDVIPENCMLRLGMTNPPYILEHLEEMAKILNHPRVYSFLHVPVQSGSDAVLLDMKREYTCSEFTQLVDFLQKRVPGVTIATDIICGFPTETEEDFDGTMALCEKYKFPSLFINQFYPRPGTPAASLPKIPSQMVKGRTKRLSEFFMSYEPYKGLEGMECQILVTEKASDGVHFVGHNKSYQQVLVSGTDDLMGKLVTVRIKSCSKFSMKGEITNVKTVLHQEQRKSIFTPTISLIAFIIIFRIGIMPFISKDWRSPGEEWVKTDEGWEKKKILECVSSYGQNNTRSPKTSTSSDEDCCEAFLSWAVEDKENLVPSSSPDGVSLPPHCYIVIKSTREIAGFNGLSDVLKRLDFRGAVQDTRRFNYICKLLDLLVSEKLASLSGCAQKVLFTVLEQVAFQVSKSGQNPDLLRKLLLQLRSLVDCACWGQPVGSTTLWRAHLATINRIINIADTLSLTQPEVVPSFMELPEECVREVMLRLADHKDLESCRASSEMMSRLCDESRLWRELTKFHFTQGQIDQAVGSSTPEKDIPWHRVYHSLRKQHGLREEYAEMIYLCRSCRCLFWGGMGHPCFIPNPDDSISHIPVPPHAFLNFFSL